MKVKDNIFNTEQRRETIQELEILISQPSDLRERPCPGCRFVTPDGKMNRSDTQFCSFNCPAAPLQMSSDPARFPIEMGIVPMVYAIYTLRKLMPCWSCEGHLDGHSLINKLPRVWFYSQASFYPKLISQAIAHMEAHHLIDNSWMVRILPFSQSMYTITYSLEPIDISLGSEGPARLESLRADIKVIATRLRKDLFAEAQKYIETGQASPFKKNISTNATPRS